MTKPPTVTVVAPEDKARLFSTLILGFSADPLARWFAPQADAYLAGSAGFFDAFAGKAFTHESAHVANDGQAVALWLPPGVEPEDELMAELMTNLVAPEILEDVYAVFEAIASFHPKEPCWYLPVIAADPNHRGEGLGSALMKYATRRCDEEGLPAYLESSNIRNVSLYERHGFEVMGEIQRGSSPNIRPMYRAAR